MRRFWVVCLCVFLAAALAAQTPRPRRGSRRRAAPRPQLVLDSAVVNDPATTDSIGPSSAGSAVLRAEILLDRAHFSPGEIDARYGRNLKKAIAAFQADRGLSATGVVDPPTWGALNTDTAAALISITVAPETLAGPFQPDIPRDILEKAKLPALNYGSPLEAIGEEFHCSPKLLRLLNPSATFQTAGEQILVPNVKRSPPGKAASLLVSESDESVTATDSAGRVLGYYPATIGSPHDPLPLGRWKITGVSRNPAFHYNPELFWDAKSTDEKARIPPGPNNPVGLVWIDLSKAHYGIHGTPEPSEIGRTQSHGCIRLTNWDAWELADMVSPGVPAILQQ